MLCCRHVLVFLNPYHAEEVYKQHIILHEGLLIPMYQYNIGQTF